MAARLLAVVLLVLTAGHAQDQERLVAIEALRVIDAESGRALALVVDGDELDLTASGVGALKLEPVGASEATRSVSFEIDGEPTAVVNAPPFALGTTEPTGERYGVLELPVRSSEDDGEEFLDPSDRDPEQFPRGFTYHTSSDLDLGLDPNHARQIVGIRFADVDLPPGAQVERAEIVFTADGTSSGALRLTIRGERQHDAEPFPQSPFFTGTFAISSRPATVASVSWFIEESWTSRERHATPDLARVVNEIVQLPGWQPGQPIAFTITGDDGTNVRRAFSYDGQRGDPSRVPLLRIEYTTPPRPPAPPLALVQGRSTLSVTPYDTFAAVGTGGTPLTVTLVNGPSAADAPPDAEPLGAESAEAEPVEAHPAETRPTEQALQETQPTFDAEHPAEQGAALETETVNDAEDRSEPRAPTIADIAPDVPADVPEPADPPAETMAPADPPIDAPTSDTLAEPASTPPAPPEPTPGRETEPSAPPQPQPAPTPRTQSPSFVLSSVWGSAVRGTLYLERDDAQGGTSTILVIELDEITLVPMSVELRYGTCSVPGDVLAPLTPIAPGDRSSATALPFSRSALQYGGFVVLARSGTPVACAVITP